MERHPSSASLGDDRSGSRYELLAKIASGGMATVYVGRLRGAAGFWRLVAIKRAHAHLIESPSYKQMLVDEAKVASRLHHPNVVAVLDVEELAGELRLVMDYVEGSSLADLIARSRDAERRLPARIATRILLDACAGLHAAHELCDEDNRPLGLVHRDVSPHNILVGIDGAARIADFGIAKHEGGAVSTTTGALKGKLAYMAPEYVEEGKLDARSDVFALGVVAWEAYAGEKLFRGANEVDTLKRVAAAEAPPLSSAAPWIGARLDSVIAAALARRPDERFETAQAFGTALETAARRADLIATAAEVGAYVRELVGAGLEERRQQIRERQDERVTVPEAPPRADPPAEATIAPALEGARDASSITLRQTTAALPARAAPGGTRRLAIGAAAIGLAAGATIALALRGGAPAPRPATTMASAPPIAPAEPAPLVTAPIAPIASATATTAASATAAAAASARAPAPRPFPKPRAAPVVTRNPAEDIAPNPY